MTTRWHEAACAMAAEKSSVTTTPFPAASASSFTTYGAPNALSASAASASVAATRAPAVGIPAAAMTSLAKALDPSMRAAPASGPKAAIAGGAQRVSDAGHERRFRPDHDKIRRDVSGHPDNVKRVVSRDGVQLRKPRHAGVARRRVELANTRVCG